MDIVYQITILFATAGITWLFGKLKTKREKTQSDLQTVESTISPLLVSIKELNEHNKMLMSELLAERKEIREKDDTISLLKSERADFIAERAEFLKKINCLERKIEKLTKAFEKSTKNDTDNTTTT